MKTVKITIEVGVPDDASHVAVDANGCPWAAVSQIELFKTPSFGDMWTGKKMIQCSIINWRETITEVK